MNRKSLKVNLLPELYYFNTVVDYYALLYRPAIFGWRMFSLYQNSGCTAMVFNAIICDLGQNQGSSVQFNAAQGKLRAASQNGNLRVESRRRCYAEYIEDCYHGF